MSAIKLNEYFREFLEFRVDEFVLGEVFGGEHCADFCELWVLD